MAQTTSRRCIQPLATNTVTDTTTETAFTRTLKIPARSLEQYAMLKFGGVTKHTGTNSTDTFRVRAYIGTAKDNTGLLVADSGALDVANDDCAAFNGWAMCKTPGVGGSAVLCGQSDSTQKTTDGGTAFSATEAQLDTTQDLYLTVTVAQSVQSASNISRLDALWYELHPYEPELVPAS